MRLMPPLLALGLVLGACVDPRVVEDHSGLGQSEIGRYFARRDIDEGRDVDLDIRSMVIEHLRRSKVGLSPADQQQLGLVCDSAAKPVRCAYEGVDRVRDAPRVFGGGTPRRSNEVRVHVAVVLLASDDADAHVTVEGRTVVTKDPR